MVRSWRVGWFPHGEGKKPALAASVRMGFVGVCRLMRTPIWADSRCTTPYTAPH